MVDKIEKALSKLTEKERKVVKNVLLKVQEGSIDSLDIKKLKGRSDIFRARKGKIRIIFRKTKESTLVLAIERRADKTYKGL